MTASRILVVDDEADIRGLLKEILSEEGYEVEIAADATQARSSRAAQVPDLVLLDIWMPDTDGITLLREWSVTDGYDCPVVMMSGHGTVETAVEATRLGAFDFVEKPLSLTKLLRTVERALDAGRRKRLSARTQGSALAVPIGKAKITQMLREQVQQAASSSSPVLLVGELGIRPRSVCTLSAFLERTRRQAVFHRGCRESWAGPGRGPVRQRARRQGRAGRLRSSSRRVRCTSAAWRI